MQDASSPSGPVAGGDTLCGADSAPAAGVADLIERLETCRTLLDEMDLPLAAAHVDMAVHVLAALVAADLP